MSNFICPTCGFNNIDCGKAGYKTDREIELEKKLDIAVKALEEAFKCLCWFYNNSHQRKKFGFLADYDENYFLATNENIYKFCRPVRKDEVTFYEDKN